jgi:hypothetical protein
MDTNGIVRPGRTGRTLRATLLPLLLVTLLPAGRAAAADGSEGLPGDWLNRHASARAAALGGARLALPDEPLAALVNPAAAAWLERGAVQVTTTRLFESTSVNSLGFALPASGRPSLAFNLLSLGSGDFERTGAGSDEVLGSFDEGNLAMGLAVAQPLGDRIAAGAQVKLARQALDEFSGTGLGFDLGLLGRVGGGVQVGVSALNLGGPTLALRMRDETYARELRGGVAVPLSGGDGLLAVDAVQRDGGDTQVHAGGRWRVQALELSLGYDIDNFAAGFSYRLPSGLQLDYAMSDHDLGLVHRVGVTWRFGGFSATASADPQVFSPTGSEPVTRFALKARTRGEATAWRLEISDVSGQLVRTYAGEGPPPADLVWDGKDAGGRPLPDGLYSYRLRVNERGGTSLQAQPGTVEISRGGPRGGIEVAR